MRLTKHLARMATEELIQQLVNEPLGLTTGEFIGAPRFCGHDTFTTRQIARILRASGEVDHRYEGSGYMRASRWTLRRAKSQRPHAV